MDQEKGLTQVIEPIENMMKRLNVNTVFGEPIKEGDQTVIPVASVSYAFGFGAGYGSGQSQPEGGRTSLRTWAKAAGRARARWARRSRRACSASRPRAFTSSRPWTRR